MPQSLFTSQTPASPDLADGSAAYSMGTYFTSSVNGTVTHIRWYFPLSAQPSGVVGGQAIKGNLFRNSDSLKLGGADAVFASPGTPGAWNQVALSTPVAITAGTLYCATIWTPRRYVASVGGASPWPVSNGNLAALTGAGRFTDGSSGNVEFPTSSFNNGCYFADVVFVADGEEEEVDTTGTGAVSVTASAVVSTQRTSSGLAVAGLAASAAVSTLRVTEGVAAAGLSASAAVATTRLTAGSAPVAVGARAAVSSARTTAGTGRVVVTGGTYAPLIGAAPLLITQSQPDRLETIDTAAGRIVTTTVMAR